MYLIRLASGREATFPTIQELALAIQRGEVDRDALIFHRRTGEWLPIERHPHFYAQVSEDAPAVRDEPGTMASMEQLDRLEPIAPTPMAPPAPIPTPPTPTREIPKPPPPPRADVMAPAARRPAERAPERAPERVPERAPGRVAPDPAPLAAPRSMRGGWALLIGALVVIGGGLGGLAIGWKLRPGEADSSAAPGYQPAPPPSSLIKPEPAAPEPRPAPAPAAIVTRDPLGPVSAEVLRDRHARAFAASRDQLAAELAAVGLDDVFGVRSFAAAAGAHSGRRIVAAALNVVGQFHRREIMMDRAYRDTAAFQTTRAGWSLEERRGWNARPSLREPYAAADLAESLLADADSLLAILSSAGSYQVRGDTIHFADAATAAAYRAQRARITDRSGPPVSDPDLRPTLTLVRRSVDPVRLPAGAP